MAQLSSSPSSSPKSRPHNSFKTQPEVTISTFQRRTSLSAPLSFSLPVTFAPSTKELSSGQYDLVVETVQIQTRDGYFLGLQRVWAPNADLRAQLGPPVLLQHGLFMAGDAWFLNSPEQSLGFILADEGFDVWVGNVRGTRWSQGHISLSEEDKEYWDWSWQELALYDLSEMINHIYLLTNSKVFIVGHSQGTIMSLAAFTQPDIAEMVEDAALLCPISYLDHIST